ncbi:hypothetical protein Tco_0451087 [Tanacetum coccineum]
MSTYLKNMTGYKHKVVKGSETRIEESTKRAGDELESDKSNKQKINEHVEAEKDDDLEEEEMKKHIADGSSKRYSSMIRMLQDIDREDLETLWKLVKEKHGINRSIDEYERVLWGDIKELCTEFEKLKHKKFQMRSMDELTFFLGLQEMQKEDGIFISQDKYVDET